MHKIIIFLLSAFVIFNKSIAMQSSHKSSTSSNVHADSLICAICTETIQGKQRVKVAPCNVLAHIMHEQCATQCQTQWKNICPQCRSSGHQSQSLYTTQTTQASSVLNTHTSSTSRPLQLPTLRVEVNVPERRSCYYTALHEAAYYGKTAMVARLLDRGADLHALENLCGYTALHEAAEEGNTETVALLSERGANLNARNKYGRTALHLAAGRGNTETVAFLLDHGANLNARDNYRMTALQEAVYHDHTETADYLRERTKETRSGFCTIQ